MADSRPRPNRPARAAILGIAILLAAIFGLIIGNAATPDTTDPGAAREEAALAARETTLEQVRTETSRQGYREGRRSGARRGRAAGRRAGRTDGRLLAQLEITETAESQAAAAQSRLSRITRSLPVPSPRSGTRGR